MKPDGSALVDALESKKRRQEFDLVDLFQTETRARENRQRGERELAATVQALRDARGERMPS